MILRTRRLKLRPYEVGDMEQFIALNCDPAARKHMNGPMTQTQAVERFNWCMSSGDAWAVTDLRYCEYIGHAFLNAISSSGDAELGFILAPRAWHSGYGTEIVKAVVEYGHTKYSRIIATVDTDHIASINVLQKAGFVLFIEKFDEYGPYYVYESVRHGVDGNAAKDSSQARS